MTGNPGLPVSTLRAEEFYPAPFSAESGRGYARHLRAKTGRFLLYVVLFEAALMGSGRMLHIGPITVKMVLFAIAIAFSIASLLCLDRLRFSTALMLASFGSLVCFGSANGFVHNARLNLVGDDISPLLSFFMLPFFELTIRSQRDIRTAMRVIQVAALTMAAGYALLVTLLFAHIVSFTALYEWVSRVGGDDFIFEGQHGRVFYKGALFIAIALIFFLFKRGFWAKIAAAVLFLSIFVVGTRGFFLALALCGLLYATIAPISAVKKLAAVGVAGLIAAVSLPAIFSLSGDKTTSNMERLVAVSQVADRVTAPSLLVGHGLGIGVPIRPEHMEIAYLEIYQKQGVVGLCWWAALIGVVAFRARKAIKAGNGELAYPLILSAAFICFESTTNPFLNNPIGMYPFLASYAGLGILTRPLGALPTKDPVLERKIT